jgi:hypothetical protein
MRDILSDVDRWLAVGKEAVLWLSSKPGKISQPHPKRIFIP